MNLLFLLMLYLGPIAIIYCIYRAVKGTRIKKIDMPMGIRTSIMNMNGPLRKYGVK